MKLFRVGKVGNLRSITLFHALARLGYEGLVITSPVETYISVGYFDRTQEVLDLKRCTELGIPVIRREVGGGTVLLDENQVFYQLIVSRKRTKLPFKVNEAYRVLSQPVIRTYERLGVETAYRPINDIVVKSTGRKISGQGAADIGECFVFVGGLLLRFNTRLMSEVFKVPEEKFRDKLYRSLEEGISWVERETGRLPSYEEVEELLIEEFGKILEFEGEGELSDEVIELADELKEEFTSEETLLEDTGRRHRTIKIKEGLHVRTAVHKAKGGLLRGEVITDGELIVSVKVWGDFTLTPKSSLGEIERSLAGVRFTKEDILRKVREFLRREDIFFPGVEEEDLLALIYGT